METLGVLYAQASGHARFIERTWVASFLSLHLYRRVLLNNESPSPKSGRDLPV